MKKMLVVTLALVIILATVSCSSNTQQLDKLNKQLAESKSVIEKKEKELKKLQKEYDDYKKRMKKFEDLSDEDLKIINKEKLEKEEEAKKAAEEEAKKGYNTEITYKQLARTPDKYQEKKVKFTGRVVQVMEGDGETEIRLATKKEYDEYYDDIIYCGYNSDIVSERVLEDDVITIYGVSKGLISYDSTIGGKITIPSVLVDKIEIKE